MASQHQASESSNEDPPSSSQDASSTPADPALYGLIDANSVTNQMWMAKIPAKLAEAWEAAPEGTVIGELVFTKGGHVGGMNGGRGMNGSSGGRLAANRGRGRTGRGPNTGRGFPSKPIKQSLTLTIPEHLTTLVPPTTRTQTLGGKPLPSSSTIDIVPLDYTVEALTKKVPALHPFTRHAPHGNITLHGTITRTCSLQMQRTERYHKLCKERLLTTVTSHRFVQPVQTSELSMKGRSAGGGATTENAGFGDSVQRFGKRMLEAAERGATGDGKKRKFEGQSIRSIVFELFSVQPYWSVKELRNASGRLEKDLRPVLAELCEFRRSGEQKGTWELKKEFRMQGGEEDAK